VYLKASTAEGKVRIGFDVPAADDLGSVEINREGYSQILASPWWEEMVADVIETPEMCDKDDPPEQVLEYARDVVSEYLRKRARL
jgi:hypothetical protein